MRCEYLPLRGRGPQSEPHETGSPTFGRSGWGYGHAAGLGWLFLVVHRWVECRYTLARLGGEVMHSTNQRAVEMRLQQVCSCRHARRSFPALAVCLDTQHRIAGRSYFIRSRFTSWPCGFGCCVFAGRDTRLGVGHVLAVASAFVDGKTRCDMKQTRCSAVLNVCTDRDKTGPTAHQLIVQGISVTSRSIQAQLRKPHLHGTGADGMHDFTAILGHVSRQTVNTGNSVRSVCNSKPAEAAFPQDWSR